MKSSKTYLIALVPALLAASTCLADNDTGSAANPVAETGKSGPEIQTIAADYFDSNWALFSDGNQAPAPMDPLAEVSANYFDANWALFSDGNQAPAPMDPLAEVSANYFDANWALFSGGNQAPAPIDPLAEVATNYFDANWALFSNNGQPYSATQVILADRTQSSDLR